MLIGCNDCVPESACDVKVLNAVITPYGFTGTVGSTNISNPVSSPYVEEDGCDNYCHGCYTMTGDPGDGDCTPTAVCTGLSNIVTWLLGEFTAMQDDTSFPWNHYKTGFFQDGNAGSPYATVGPQGSTTGFGGDSYGSNYTEGYGLVALNGSTDGSLCAYAQIVAFRISGQLFITPLDVPDVTESCEEMFSGVCSAGGSAGSAVYYIPLPPLDLCANPESGGIQIAYLPFQTNNSTDCLPAFSGGTVSPCLSPDPFFGSDPP
jgi:hypothetical protein